MTVLAPPPRYLTSLRGHVASVYQVAWSADSRLLVSGSSDSTLKVWDIKTGKLNIDLPGHADEVSPPPLPDVPGPRSASNPTSAPAGLRRGLEPRRAESGERREGQVPPNVSDVLAPKLSSPPPPLTPCVLSTDGGDSRHALETSDLRRRGEEGVSVPEPAPPL